MGAGDQPVNKLRRDRVQDGSYYLDAVSTVGLTAGREAPAVSPAKRETTLDFRVSGKIDGRFAAAGQDRWTATDCSAVDDQNLCTAPAEMAGRYKNHPFVASKVSRITLGALDLEAAAKN